MTAFLCDVTQLLRQVKLLFFSWEGYKFMKKVVIIGAGFGGLTVAKELAKYDFNVVVIDKTNHHLFQPLLYQVATAALSPGDIAIPVRSIFSKNKNVEVLLGEVKKIDKEHRKVVLNESEIDFDYLIVATGSTFIFW